jgi:hypothetical protein
MQVQKNKQVSWMFIETKKTNGQEDGGTSSCLILPSVKTELRRKSSRRSQKTFRWFLDQRITDDRRWRHFLCASVLTSIDVAAILSSSAGLYSREVPYGVE